MGVWDKECWPPGLFHDLGGNMDPRELDDSLSLQMEKLSVVKYIWETPLKTVKDFGERLCQSCNHFRKDALLQRKLSIHRKLQDWAVSFDIAIAGYYKLLERALNYENNLMAIDSKETIIEKPRLHLISHGYVPKIPLASRSSIGFEDLDTLQSGTRSVTLLVRDFEGKPCHLIDRHTELRTVLLCGDGQEHSVSIAPGNDVGEYSLSFATSVSGIATLSVKLHGMDVAGSPVNFVVYPERDWNDHILPSFYGHEGTDPREFVRPWGVCCDRLGRTLIADRSNNRVQVLTDEGDFLFSFGKKGTAPGEFQLVTSVAASRNGDVVCVDKDNHRIQIFDENGRFKKTFGSFGDQEGQFHYPWDVDVNARGDIVVTDSRNCRIQVFDASGKFISAFSKSQDCKDLLSPRGVSFISTDTVVVSDFDRHKLFIINIKTKSFSVIGREGSDLGELKRPQGVAWHPQGFIAVSDSRNNRIQAFKLDGKVKWHIGSPDLPVDRPCGIAISHKGTVVAVDFGHHRVLTLE